MTVNEKRVGNTIVLVAEKHKMPKYIKEYIKAKAKKFLRNNPNYSTKYSLTEFKNWRSYRENIFIHKGGAVFRERHNGELVFSIGRKHPKGYLQIYIRGPLMHRLVATVWKKNKDIESKPIVNHKNGIKTDNCIDNLEWCNNSSNIKHARDLGLNPYNKPTQGLKIQGQRKGASKYFGVLFERGRGKWVGQVRHDNVVYGRRRFDTEDEAAQHYNNVCDILEIDCKPRNPFPKQKITKKRVKGERVWTIGEDRFLFTVTK